MTAKRKPLADAPIDEIIRLLAQAAGIARRRRISAALRRTIADALHEAFIESSRLRERKRK